jgi:uncharacterized protein with HEPN domain
MEVERPLRLRLFDILELTSAGLTAEALLKEIARYRAIERWLEIISEASRHISDELKQRESGVDWIGVAAFGNVMRHGYEAVDSQIIWNIITSDLPVLKAASERLYTTVKLPADPWPDAQSK